MAGVAQEASQWLDGSRLQTLARAMGAATTPGDAARGARAELAAELGAVAAVMHFLATVWAGPPGASPAPPASEALLARLLQPPGAQAPGSETFAGALLALAVRVTAPRAAEETDMLEAAAGDALLAAVRMLAAGGAPPPVPTFLCDVAERCAGAVGRCAAEAASLERTAPIGGGVLALQARQPLVQLLLITLQVTPPSPPPLPPTPGGFNSAFMI